MYEVAAAQWFNTMVQWQPFPLSREEERGKRERRREAKGPTKGRKGVRAQEQRAT